MGRSQLHVLDVRALELIEEDAEQRRGGLGHLRRCLESVANYERRIAQRAQGVTEIDNCQMRWTSERTLGSQYCSTRRRAGCDGMKRIRSLAHSVAARRMAARVDAVSVSNACRTVPSRPQEVVHLEPHMDGRK